MSDPTPDAFEAWMDKAGVYLPSWQADEGPIAELASEMLRADYLAAYQQGYKDALAAHEALRTTVRDVADDLALARQNDGEVDASDLAARLFDALNA